MKIKAEWFPYIHKIRKKELDIIFKRSPKRNIFERALELGAGDGFQSEILSTFVNHLTATDLNPDRLKKSTTSDIEYRICDAEIIDTYFETKKFDFVFSSNLLEHLPSSEAVLKAIHNTMKDEAITIHVMPSPFWKLCQMLLFYPNLFITKLEAITEAESATDFLKEKLSKMKEKLGKGNTESSPLKMGNNPKMQSHRSYSYIRKLLWPIPHGACDGNIREFVAWRKKRWLGVFNRSGFNVIKVIKGPVNSGYGFGFDRLRFFLERAGLTSEYIYVAIKKGRQCPYSNYF
jgi:2-polyprenyl-3-methyl-5-hydroxy-6-metoxy-1,4-benzoquinol methylase